MTRCYDDDGEQFEIVSLKVGERVLVEAIEVIDPARPKKISVKLTLWSQASPSAAEYPLAVYHLNHPDDFASDFPFGGAFVTRVSLEWMTT